MSKSKPKKRSRAKKLSATYLSDAPSDVSHMRAVPVIRPEGDSRPSRVLVPSTARDNVTPSSPDNGKAGYDKLLVELARTSSEPAKPQESPEQTSRERDLHKLEEILTGRRSNHGKAEDNFAKIAEGWNLWLRWRGLPPVITYRDVPILMMFVKLAREASGHGDDDNGIDGAGYLLIYNELRNKGKHEAQGAVGSPS